MLLSTVIRLALAYVLLFVGFYIITVNTNIYTAAGVIVVGMAFYGAGNK